MVAAVPAMMLAAGAAAAASEVASGIGQMNAANYNSATAANQAQADVAAAGERAAQQQYETNQRVGQSIANAGASGVDPNQGSPVTATSDLATQGALAKALTLYQGQAQAQSLLSQAAIDKSQGQLALIGGIAGAGTTLLSAGTNYGMLTGGGAAAGTSPLTGVPLAGSGFSAFSVPKY